MAAWLLLTFFVCLYIPNLASAFNFLDAFWQMSICFMSICQYVQYALQSLACNRNLYIIIFPTRNFFMCKLPISKTVRSLVFIKWYSEAGDDTCQDSASLGCSRTK